MHNIYDYIKICLNKTGGKSVLSVSQHKIKKMILLNMFSGGSGGKESVYNAGDLGLIPVSGRFPGEGNGNPLQYSCLENPMDRGAWCPWGRKELDMTEQIH
ncbi:unnamed protein product [Rangifer tarandus platyrhynchus]|uniref:Uncharacterized protein n=2 Tax=Rangifer tarandus platyrhynchus TaxID=3082113 RepID=A0AC59YD59_RANTA|nr:unnamed protein product [Rangifer tarandus platyrhynchus]